MRAGNRIGMLVLIHFLVVGVFGYGFFVTLDKFLGNWPGLVAIIFSLGWVGAMFLSSYLLFYVFDDYLINHHSYPKKHKAQWKRTGKFFMDTRYYSGAGPSHSIKEIHKCEYPGCNKLAKRVSEKRMARIEEKLEELKILDLDPHVLDEKRERY